MEYPSRMLRRSGIDSGARSTCRLFEQRVMIRHAAISWSANKNEAFLGTAEQYFSVEGFHPALWKPRL